jgi:hypothetical protein
VLPRLLELLWSTRIYPPFLVVYRMASLVHQTLI